MLTLGPNSKNVLKTRKHEIATTNSSLSVCSNSRPAPRAKVYQAAARLCCARNVPFSVAPFWAGGVGAFRTPSPRGHGDRRLFSRSCPRTFPPSGSSIFTRLIFKNKCQPPPTLRVGGSELFGPQPPGGSEASVRLRAHAPSFFSTRHRCGPRPEKQTCWICNQTPLIV